MAEAAVLSPETPTYISADLLPGVAEARAELRDQAWAMVAERQAQHASGQEIPLTINALSTAEYVLECEPGTTEYEERFNGLKQDCQRLVAEWFRKKKSEYFPESRHFFDAQTGDFYSHGLSIRQMTENALRPIEDDPEEVARRVNERVENETPLLVQKLGGLALGQQVKIRTVSECTDKAIKDYEADRQAGRPHAGYNGYVPEIQKVMIRDTRIDDQTGDRIQEQIGLRGTYIDHWVIQEAIRRKGVETQGMDKTELHGTQLIVQDDLIDFVASLDQVASENWCTNIFLGEEVAQDFIKDYTTVRSEALKRQAEQEAMAATTASFILDLAQDKYDPYQAPAKVEAFVKSLLIDEAKKDTTVALQIFDKPTAVGLQQVAILESQGRYDEAEKLQASVERAAPGGGYCGAGSCGLKAINAASSSGKELAKKLKAEAGDKLVADGERGCRFCGSKKVAYAYNSHKVNKYCGGCERFTSERKSAKRAA